MRIKRRLYFVLTAIIAVIMIGSIGYYLLFGGRQAFVDCLYMTVISLTSVGYGEIIQVTGNVPAQIFTMILITFGMGIILYGISTLTAQLIEGELTGIMRREQMLKRIEKLADHYIVCGGGQTGRHVLAELVTNKESVVLIEQSEENIEQCKTIKGLLFIQGDATEDENLTAAGIKKARGIVITLPSDKDTLYVTMSSKMLNPDLRIISRMIDQRLESKLRKAGADQVVSPNFIGALRMASEMMRPAAVSFLDGMLRSGKGTLRIHQIMVSPNSIFLGKPIKETKIKEKFDLLVLGAQFKGGSEIEFNPSPESLLEEATTLIVMGDVENIDKAKRVF